MNTPIQTCREVMRVCNLFMRERNVINYNKALLHRDTTAQYVLALELRTNYRYVDVSEKYLVGADQ